MATNKVALKGLADELATAATQEDVAEAARNRVGEILSMFSNGDLEGSASDLASESNEKTTEAKEAFELVKAARTAANANKRALHTAANGLSYPQAVCSTE